jgi:hypothetical protein
MPLNSISLKPQGYVLGDCKKCGALCVKVSKRDSVCADCKRK